MPTVVLDFDSTLVACESLEVILAPRLAGEPGLAARVAEITNAGMAGTLPFRESLRQRLAIASPRLSEVRAFADAAHERLTPGMEGLVAALARRKVEVWIVSGAFREAMLPLARRLAIPEERVLGTRMRWSERGELLGPDPTDPFSISKVDGVRALAPAWRKPCIGAGDGMSDFALAEAGLVDFFLAFTAVARRPEVVATGAPEARDCPALLRLIEERL
ncbi:MAG: HAD-IB family phosphatase [Planctomycetaceae bacterium]